MPRTRLVIANVTATTSSNAVNVIHNEYVAASLTDSYVKIYTLISVTIQLHASKKTLFVVHVQLLHRYRCELIIFCLLLAQTVEIGEVLEVQESVV